MARIDQAEKLFPGGVVADHRHAGQFRLMGGKGGPVFRRDQVVKGGKLILVEKQGPQGKIKRPERVEGESFGKVFIPGENLAELVDFGENSVQGFDGVPKGSPHQKFHGPFGHGGHEHVSAGFGVREKDLGVRPQNRQAPETGSLHPAPGSQHGHQNPFLREKSPFERKGFYQRLAFEVELVRFDFKHACFLGYRIPFAFFKKAIPNIFPVFRFQMKIFFLAVYTLCAFRPWYGKLYQKVLSANRENQGRNPIFHEIPSFTPSPLRFGCLFLRGKLGPGTGMAVRFAKAPAGIYAFIGEAKRDSAKEGGRLTAPPGLMERPPPRDFAKRSAVPVPCGDFEVLDPFILLKSEEEQGRSTLLTSFSITDIFRILIRIGFLNARSRREES